MCDVESSYDGEQASSREWQSREEASYAARIRQILRKGAGHVIYSIEESAR